MSDAQVKRIKANELTPDIRNANRGTERGRYALETSLREYGAGRSILVDKHGRIVAGNKTLETAAEMGLDDVIVVQTDGTQVVAVQRMDLDLAQDGKARMLAYADNRVGQLDLDFDPEVIAEDLASGLSLDRFWFDFELDEIAEEVGITDLKDAPEDNDRNMGDKRKQIKPVLYADEIADFEAAIKATGMNNRGHAIIHICREYLKINEKGQFDFSLEGVFEA